MIRPESARKSWETRKANERSRARRFEELLAENQKLKTAPAEALRRARKKEADRIVASQDSGGSTSKRLPKPPAQPAPCGLANLGDIADLRRVLPVSVRLDIAWAALWAHCLEVVDERRRSA